MSHAYNTKKPLTSQFSADILLCCILRSPGGERTLDVVTGGTELEPQVKTGSWAGRTHSQ